MRCFARYSTTRAEDSDSLQRRNNHPSTVSPCPPHYSFTATDCFSLTNICPNQLIPAEQSLYAATTLLLKTSLSIFYLRFLLHAPQRLVIHLSLALYALCALALIPLVIFICGVPSRVNMAAYFGGTCIPFSIYARLAIVHGAVNSLTDFVFALLPIGVLVRAQLPLATKVSAVGVVALALLGSVASCVRVAYVHGLEPEKGFYVEGARPLIWTVVEPGLGILAACLATLRPLFRGCVGGVRGVVGRVEGGSGGSPRGTANVEAGDAESGLELQQRQRQRLSQLQSRGVLVTDCMTKTSNRVGSLVWDSVDDFAQLGYAGIGRGKGARRGLVTTTVVGNSCNHFEMVELHKKKDLIC